MILHNLFKRFWFSLVFALLLGESISTIAQERYGGITRDNPTGSTGISVEGLVAAYDFETYTKDGKLLDFGPFGNHGEVGRHQNAEGLFGKARIFTDMTDVVDLPENQTLNLKGPLTIAVWLKLSKPKLHQHILSCDDIFVLWTTELNQYRLADTQGQGFTTAANTAQTEIWHSVVAVLSATRGNSLTRKNIKIFIDGELVTGTHDSQWSPSSLRTVDGCLIGASSALPFSHQNLRFEGVVDEMQVFSRALSEKEVRIFSSR